MIIKFNNDEIKGLICEHLNLSLTDVSFNEETNNFLEEENLEIEIFISEPSKYKSILEILKTKNFKGAWISK